MADTRESSRNERLNRLLECSSEGICEVDAQGRCTDSNAAGAHLLGYDECELVGAVLSALEQIRELEQQRGEVWEQAAHDLRGNLSVVANVTVASPVMDVALSPALISYAFSRVMSPHSITCSMT
jgi:PAS domain-containing protein